MHSSVFPRLVLNVVVVWVQYHSAAFFIKFSPFNSSISSHYLWSVLLTMHSGLILFLSPLCTKFDYKISVPISLAQWRTAFTVIRHHNNTDWKLAESAGRKIIIERERERELHYCLWPSFTIALTLARGLFKSIVQVLTLSTRRGGF